MSHAIEHEKYILSEQLHIHALSFSKFANNDPFLLLIDLVDANLYTYPQLL